jgi:arylsulfatase A-like enzyme
VEPIQPFQTPVGNVKELGLSEEILRRVRGLYSAEVAFVDHWIGNFMAKVQDAGLLDNSAVMYLSDHGILLGERGWIGKTGSQLHREIYHTPFVIRHPQRKRAGERSDYFASTNDVGATIISWLGQRVPGQMDGEDLSALFEGREPPPRQFATACYESHFMCNDGRWYLLADSTGKSKALYDTKQDADELNDVAATNPDVVDRL